MLLTARAASVDIPILTTRTRDDDQFAARSAGYLRKHNVRRR
jgi:hypothetical protein